jgi:general stress protein 26
MNVWEDSLRVMTELFAKDCQFSLATAIDNVPSVRVVDTFYDNEAFYIVTYAQSQKAREIEGNAHVSLCRELYRFSGTAQNIGHPLNAHNSEIREKLIRAFEPWYFKHNNEQDENMCYIRINLKSGFFYKDGQGYAVDFMQKTADAFEFKFDNVIV